MKILFWLTCACFVGLSVSGTWLVLDLFNKKDQSFVPKQVQQPSCIPQINTIPYQLRGYYLKYRPEQKV